MKITKLKGDDYPSIVGSVRDKDKPIYRWHDYKHSFSKDLVDKLIDEVKLSEGSWILDPYVGSGTTLLACKEKSIGGIGYDISPFAVFLTNTKLDNYSKNELIKSLQNILKKTSNSNSNNNYDLPDIPLIKKAYRKGIWNEISSIRRQILKIKVDKNRNFLLLALFSILESVSNTTKSGGFLRITKRKIRKGTVKIRFKESALSMIGDLEVETLRKNKAYLIAHIGDARKLRTRRMYNAIITSPPYLNRHDYTRIYSLELILNFIKDNEQLKKLRYDTLRSHVEARKKYNSNGYTQPTKLTSIIKRIEKNGTNNGQITAMISGYFEDMYLCLKEMKRVLNPNGKIALVVSNVRFSGVSIPVDELLAKIGEAVGLKIKEIRIVRFRGNSSQQMRDYKKRLSRESIIIWGN